MDKSICPQYALVRWAEGKDIKTFSTLESDCIHGMDAHVIRQFTGNEFNIDVQALLQSEPGTDLPIFMTDWRVKKETKTRGHNKTSFPKFLAEVLLLNDSKKLLDKLLNSIIKASTVQQWNVPPKNSTKQFISTKLLKDKYSRNGTSSDDKELPSPYKQSPKKKLYHPKKLGSTPYIYTEVPKIGLNCNPINISGDEQDNAEGDGDSYEELLYVRSPRKKTALLNKRSNEGSSNYLDNNTLLKRRIHELEGENNKLTRENKKYRTMIFESIPGLLQKCDEALDCRTYRQQPTAGDETASNKTAKLEIMDIPSSSNEKQIEIYEGSGEYLPVTVMQNLKNMRDYKSLTKALLTSLFPRHVLLKSTLRGGSKKKISGEETVEREPLDQGKVNALYAAVLEKFPYTERCAIGIQINQKLTDLRNSAAKKDIRQQSI